MQFKTFTLALITAALSAPAASASPTSKTLKVTFDQTYDNASKSLLGVACSNGENGLLTKGFTTLGSLPAFPYVGGAQFVEGWNSAMCGSCWTLTYKGKSINVVAVDTAGVGFNLAKQAFDALADPFAMQQGSLEAVVARADDWLCHGGH